MGSYHALRARQVMDRLRPAIPPAIADMPETQLWIAVLQQLVRDYMLPFGLVSRRARALIDSQDDIEPAELIGIDSEYVRRVIREALRAGPA